LTSPLVCVKGLEPGPNLGPEKPEDPAGTPFIRTHIHTHALLSPCTQQMHDLNWAYELLATHHLVLFPRCRFRRYTYVHTYIHTHMHTYIHTHTYPSLLKGSDETKRLGQKYCVFAYVKKKGGFRWKTDL
jgi:hypothetical protein